jgi:protein-disulfide isomerase
MKLRSSHFSILIGLAFLALAITLQIHFSRSNSLLELHDPTIIAVLYNPQGNSLAGNPDGEVTLVEFFDYNCKYCRLLHPKIQTLITANPGLRVVYKEFLLFGEKSIPATSAALAAEKQNKYLPMQNALLTATQPLTEEAVLKLAQAIGLNIKKLKKDMSDPKIQAQIQANTALASRLEIDGAPMFIVANSQIAKDPTNATPQYLFTGSDRAEIKLQQLIDKIKNH